MLLKYKGLVFIEELEKKYKKKIDIEYITHVMCYYPKTGFYQVGWEIIYKGVISWFFEDSRGFEYYTNEENEIKEFFEKKGNVKINVACVL